MRSSSITFPAIIFVLSAPAATTNITLVKLGQGANLGGPRIQPMKLIEDSRCPMNARCVRAGRVVVRARISGGRWAQTMNLKLGEPVRVADGTLTLVAATPERMAGRPIKRRQMRFDFEFQGGL